MKRIAFFFLLRILVFAGIAAQQSNNGIRTLSFDYTKIKGPHSKMFKECIGAGRANEGLRADWQRQLRMVKEECDFRYIRFHGLLTDDMGVYTENRKGEAVYSFQYIDELFDFLLSINIKPFVELGFMPNALASGNKTIFWWKGNITPPKDYDKWAALITALLKHWEERYGVEEVKSWYFEVWNEPNLKDAFWSGDQAEYFKLYKYTAQAVKGVNKAYRVGGPATAGAGWVPEMLAFCEKNSVPIDFVSTHTYGVRSGHLDEYGQGGTVLDGNPASVSGDVIRSRKQISESAFPKLELHYTEWSSSYTPADPVHDSYHEAAYILEKLKQVGNAPTSMSYWVFTDIFEEPGPRFTPFHGGFGLINYQDIKKSAYFAYKYLNMLGSTELENSDPRSVACRDEAGNVQILLWDFTHTHPGDSVNNQAYFNRILYSKPKGGAEIKLAGIPAGKYEMKFYRIGFGVNDPYTMYLKMGAPAQLTRQQVADLKSMNSGEALTTAKIAVKKDGIFSQKMPMSENDVVLLTLTRLK
jgi:xylan 1,4-beta-xylosidase